MIVVQITGEMYSGKTYLANYITTEIGKEGYSILRIPFARGLKYYIRKYFGITKFGLSENIVEYIDEKLKLGNKTDIEVINELIDNQWNLFAKTIKWKEMNEIEKEEFEKIVKVLKNYIRNIYKNINYKDNVRHLFQWFGTEIIRDHVNEDYWVSLVQKIIINNMDDVDVVIIDDYRFPNEELNSSIYIDVIKIRLNVSIETRSKRSGVPVLTLDEMSKHGSEKYVKSLNVNMEVDNDENNCPKQFKDITEIISKQLINENNIGD